MPLNIQQKKWITAQGRGAEDVVNMIVSGRLSQTDYEEFAGSDARLASQLAAVRQLLAERPDPREIEEFNAVVNLINGNAADQATYDAAAAYVQAWGTLTSAADHVSQIGEFVNRFERNRTFSELETRVKDALAQYAATKRLPGIEISQAIQKFLYDHGMEADASAQLQECRQWREQINEMNRAMVQAAFNDLFDAEGHIKNISSVAGFMRANTLDTEMTRQLDEKIWEWVITQPDKVKAGQTYNEILGGSGMHTMQVASLAHEAQEWENYAGGNIYQVMDFLNTHPHSSFADEARRQISRLKNKELEKIKKAPNKYPFDAFMSLRQSGMFSDQELMEAAGVAGDPEFFQAILDLDAIRQSLPPQPNSPSALGTGVGEEDITDVLFFGIESSGKTCVLSGLLVNQGMSYNSAAFSGKYAQLVETYTRQGVALEGTIPGFIATIKCSARRNNRKYSFNLFEISGESFKGDIANSTSLNFEDMGHGATEILKSDNDKIFFILLDPTNDYVQQNVQYNSIKNFINLLFGEVNGEGTGQDLLDRVRGLHFIVTKADTMGNTDWREGALAHVRHILNQNDIEEIIVKCRENGINYSKDDAVNGHPRVFPFSLGQFTVGNIFRYKPESSSAILDVILDYCTPEKDRNFWDRIRDILTNSSSK